MLRWGWGVLVCVNVVLEGGYFGGGEGMGEGVHIVFELALV
jgi:hypothetical protein